jgi:hypothetical protein
MRLDLTGQHPSVDRAKVEPPRRHGVLLIAKLILTGVAVFAAGEASWRLVGARPVQGDLLAFARFRAVARNSPSAVALIGSSRVLCDLDPRILKLELPNWEFYQLGISGTSALPMLENLAQDGTFRGQVLCEFHISYAVDASPFPERDAHEANWLRYVHFIQKRPYLDFVTNWFTETLRPRSALVEAKYKDKDFPASLFTAFRQRLEFRHHRSESGSPEQGVPLPDAVPREDRFLALHHRGKDNSADIAAWADLMRKRSERADGAIQHIASWVEAIRRHGGDVIFIRMPVTGSLKRIEDDAYPDQDRPIQFLVAHQITVIDSAKEPTLSGFECPDDSHLDADDAERFSAALSRILIDRQLLKRSAPDNR